MPTAGTITLRILDGPEKGKEFPSVPLPLSIGREPGNTILLNDERISRYHLKILRQHGKTILSDSGSTNGTRVNGETVTAAAIHAGDIISLGRSVLIIGSRRDIRERLMLLDEGSDEEGVVRSFLDEEEWEEVPEAIQREIQALAGDGENPLLKLHRLQPPALPTDMNMEQFSQIADIFLYFHLRLRLLINAGVRHLAANQDENESEEIVLRRDDWQNLLDLYARTAKYLREMSEI